MRVGTGDALNRYGFGKLTGDAAFACERGARDMG